MPELKRCIDCKEYKQDTEDNFTKLKSGRLTTTCKECVTEMILENKRKKAWRRLSDYHNV